MATAPAPAPAPATGGGESTGPDFKPPRTGKDAPTEGPYRMGEGSAPNPDADFAAKQKAEKDAYEAKKKAASGG